MPNLVLDSSGKPSPQYLNESGSEFEYQRGKDGGMNVNLNGINHKLASDVFTGKLVPVQLINQNGDIISKFGYNEKSIITVFTQGNKSDTVTSSAIDTSEVDNATFVVITNNLENITEFTIQGEFNSTYHPIYTITSDNDDIINTKGIITIGINSTNNMIIPKKIKIVLKLSTSTTIATYMVSK